MAPLTPGDGSDDGVLANDSDAEGTPLAVTPAIGVDVTKNALQVFQSYSNWPKSGS